MQPGSNLRHQGVPQGKVFTVQHQLSLNCLPTERALTVHGSNSIPLDQALSWLRSSQDCPPRGAVQPHSSDEAVNAFLVADSVILEALWSGGDFGCSDVLISADPINRRQGGSWLSHLRQNVRAAANP